MTTVRNTVVLKGDLGDYDEGVCSGAVTPGMLVEMMTTAPGHIDRNTFRAATTRGGVCERLFAIEDALRGYTIDNDYATGDVLRFHKSRTGNHIYALLHAGENVDESDNLISYGDGTLCKAASSIITDITAPSTDSPAGTAETAFSNGTVTIPANTLKAGDIIRVRGHAVVSNQNSTDTLNIKLKLGSTVIVASGALDVATGDVCFFDATLVIRTIGASGTLVATGTITIGVPGTSTVKAFALGSTAIDTTAAITISVTYTWSVSSASNVVALQSLLVEQVKGGTSSGQGSAGGFVIGKVIEAVDNSAGIVSVRVRCRIL